MNPSKIEWTDAVWNPVTGCTKVSQGCKNCYAERMSRRLQAMGSPKYDRGFEVVTHDSALGAPLTWLTPKFVFVNSMSDLFHKFVPASFIEEVFAVMNAADQHTFQVLTKRPGRARALSKRFRWTPNIWLGTSIESERYVGARLQSLKESPAMTKFLSLEPLLGPLPDLDLDGIDWVIVGGESGPRSRPIKAEWIRDIRDQCLASETPFFFKQWGGVFKKKHGRELDGRTWDQLPMKLSAEQPYLPFVAHRDLFSK